MNAKTNPSITLLVAVDSSEQSGWALDEAIVLARELRARISLLHVVDVVPLLAPEFAADEAAHQALAVQDGWELVRRIARQVPNDLFGQGLLRRGDAAAEIVGVVSELRPRFVVIGTHARGGLGRFLLGSVAEQVVRRANCPVLTVAHPKGAPEKEAPASDSTCISRSAVAAEVCCSRLT